MPVVMDRLVADGVQFPARVRRQPRPARRAGRRCSPAASPPATACGATRARRGGAFFDDASTVGDLAPVGRLPDGLLRQVHEQLRQALAQARRSRRPPPPGWDDWPRLRPRRERAADGLRDGGERGASCGTARGGLLDRRARRAGARLHRDGGPRGRAVLRVRQHRDAPPPLGPRCASRGRVRRGAGLRAAEPVRAGRVGQARLGAGAAAGQPGSSKQSVDKTRRRQPRDAAQRRRASSARLLDRLEALGIADDTVVVFTSDKRAGLGRAPLDVEGLSVGGVRASAARDPVSGARRPARGGRARLPGRSADHPGRARRRRGAGRTATARASPVCLGGGEAPREHVLIESYAGAGADMARDPRRALQARRVRGAASASSTTSSRIPSSSGTSPRFRDHEAVWRALSLALRGGFAAGGEGP